MRIFMNFVSDGILPTLFFRRHKTPQTSIKKQSNENTLIRVLFQSIKDGKRNKIK